MHLVGYTLTLLPVGASANESDFGLLRGGCDNRECILRFLARSWGARARRRERRRAVMVARLLFEVRFDREGGRNVRSLD